MKVISVRSPYTLIVNETGQSGARLELFIWNKGTTEPTIPTYNLSKKIPSLTQIACNFNISPYCREFINFTYPDQSEGLAEENNESWCFVKAKEYSLVGKTETLISTTTMVAVKGFTNYINGFNQSDTNDFVPLSSYNKTIYYDRRLLYPYVNFLFDYNGVDEISVFYYSDTYTGTIPYIFLDNSNISGVYNFKIPITNEDINFENGNYFRIISSADYVIYEGSCKLFCEPVYSPKICKFINSKGGWEFLTFFKGQTRTIDVQSSSASFFPKQLNYDASQGQTQTFNTNGNEKITMHTGYVPESYSQSIKELLLSEKVMLDEFPVKVNTKSIESKTQLKSNNISYEIEFEYAFDLINNVV